jgi:phospholipase C
VADTDADAVRRLRSLKHIVVVMMENRSFDHMLGYLPKEGMADVDGLTGAEYNLGPDKKKRPVHAFDTEANKVLRPGEALQKKFDPDHSVAGVQKQLGNGYGNFASGGFVQSFVDSRKKADNVEDKDFNVPMGYYTSKDVPVYDHLARQYCVCDRWFASVPGDTWPNRMYSLAGQDGPNVSENNGLWDKITDLPPLKRLKKVPLFNVPAFTRHLDSKDWRWYSHDPGTLRVVDGAYRDLGNPMAGNFAFFDKRKVDGLTQLMERPIVGGGAFLDDAARNKLPKVSWIDPNFVDLSVRETVSNDDHPPSDIRAGQAFVYDVYNTLRHTPDWPDTLLVVTYDEHGGFYDHVMPPLLSAADEPKRHKTFGLRVPALIVGPRVKRRVLHEPTRAADGRPEREQPQWDHTSLIKTILLSALPAAKADAAIKKMPGRVQRAPHLGEVLLDTARTDIDSPRNEGNLMEAWRQEARRRREIQPDDVRVAQEAGVNARSKAPDGAGQPVVLTDFQMDWHMVASALKKAGIDA